VIGQAVIDDGGDERPVLGGGRLPLDKRGHLEHVVRGQVLGPRVAEVDVGKAPLEVLELVGDQRRGLRRLDEGERVGEEEALERRDVPWRPVPVGIQ
jgi:hypothetical protein